MRLKDYLKSINVKPVPWAKQNGLSPSTIWRITNGITFPDPNTIKAVEKATKGKVKPIDWFITYNLVE